MIQDEWINMPATVATGSRPAPAFLPFFLILNAKQQ